MRAWHVPWWPIWLLGALMMLAPRVGLTETTVPIDLQVELLRKVVRFERGFVERAGPQVKLIVLARTGNTSSERAVAQLASAFERVHDIVGKPIAVTTEHYSSATALKRAVVQAGACLLYLTPGFESEMGDIAASLEGVPVITISTDGDQVEHGAVLGFELVAAHPKITINVTQAKKQSLDFNSDLFRLARIVK